jgi:hypothetical protein
MPILDAQLNFERNKSATKMQKRRLKIDIEEMTYIITSQCSNANEIQHNFQGSIEEGSARALVRGRDIPTKNMSAYSHLPTNGGIPSKGELRNTREVMTRTCKRKGERSSIDGGNERKVSDPPFPQSSDNLPL